MAKLEKGTILGAGAGRRVLLVHTDLLAPINPETPMSGAFGHRERAAVAVTRAQSASGIRQTSR